MSADLLRRAAALMREDCPIPERSRRYGFIDFPTGFAMQVVIEQGDHDAACSSAQTSGAILCDCEAIYAPWRRWRSLLAVADWLDASAAEHPAALAVARAYLGERS